MSYLRLFQCRVPPRGIQGGREGGHQAGTHNSTVVISHIVLLNFENNSFEQDNVVYNSCFYRALELGFDYVAMLDADEV